MTATPGTAVAAEARDVLGSGHSLPVAPDVTLRSVGAVPAALEAR